MPCHIHISFKPSRNIQSIHHIHLPRHPTISHCSFHPSDHPASKSGGGQHQVPGKTELSRRLGNTPKAPIPIPPLPIKRMISPFPLPPHQNPPSPVPAPELTICQTHPPPPVGTGSNRRGTLRYNNLPPSLSGHLPRRVPSTFTTAQDMRSEKEDQANSNNKQKKKKKPGILSTTKQQQQQKKKTLAENQIR